MFKWLHKCYYTNSGSTIRPCLSLKFYMLIYTHRIGIREGMEFYCIINESQGYMNLEDSCHVYIKTFCHLKSAVGMRTKNSMLFQQCPNY